MQITPTPLAINLSSKVHEIYVIMYGKDISFLTILLYVRHIIRRQIRLRLISTTILKLNSRIKNRTFDLKYLSLKPQRI